MAPMLEEGSTHAQSGPFFVCVFPIFSVCFATFLLLDSAGTGPSVSAKRSLLRYVLECAVNSAALSYYAVILCTALMQHIATHAR
jgi:hypothetical protein